MQTMKKLIVAVGAACCAMTCSAEKMSKKDLNLWFDMAYMASGELNECSGDVTGRDGMLDIADRIELRRRVLRKVADLGYDSEPAAVSFDKKEAAVAAISSSKTSLNFLATKSDSEILEIVHNFKKNCQFSERQLQELLVRFK